MDALGSANEFIDITVPFSGSVPTWPTHCPIDVRPLRRMAEGGSSNVSLLDLSSHSGTHVDANWHFIDDGAPARVVLGRGR